MQVGFLAKEDRLQADGRPGRRREGASSGFSAENQRHGARSLSSAQRGARGVGPGIQVAQKAVLRWRHVSELDAILMMARACQPGCEPAMSSPGKTRSKPSARNICRAVMRKPMRSMTPAGRVLRCSTPRRGRQTVTWVCSFVVRRSSRCRKGRALSARRLVRSSTMPTCSARRWRTMR